MAKYSWYFSASSSDYFCELAFQEVRSSNHVYFNDASVKDDMT